VGVDVDGWVGGWVCTGYDTHAYTHTHHTHTHTHTHAHTHTHTHEQDEVKGKFSMKNYVLDCYIRERDWRVFIIDFNVFGLFFSSFLCVFFLSVACPAKVYH
jgi:hypothetical protein